jgi:predicted DNA-binding transcriptional regulator YafY
MIDNDIKRLTRLAAILTQLQSKRITTAVYLSEKFNVSTRTIYRDIKSLEQAGIPIITEEGKGYSIMEGYHLPPVMFTESEANALITAELLIVNNNDTSLINEYTQAIAKIKAVLRTTTKDKANLLSSRLVFRQYQANEVTSHYLSVLQLALTNYSIVDINYSSASETTPTQRLIEPFALYSTQHHWLLIAFCRLRNDFRAFRLDRINSLQVTSNKFEPHQLSLEEYFEICREKYKP